MRLWPLALLCSGGCAQLFGLDETTAAPDASPDDVSLEVQRVSVGATVVKAPQDESGQMATFLADDGAGGYTEVPGTLVPPNQFTAALPDGTPSVLFTTPDMTPHFFASGRHQKVNFYAFERPGAPVAPSTSKIMLTATLPTPYITGESFNLVAIGPWNQHPLAAAELPMPDTGATTIAPPPIDYTTQFTSILGSTTNPRISAADDVVLLRYRNGRLTGYMETQFDQSDGTDPVGGVMTAVTEDKTLNATVDPAGYAARYAMVRPATSGLAMNWSINLAPGADVGQSRGIVFTANASAMTDMRVNTMYGNPFNPRFKAVFVYSTSSSRTVTSGMAMFGLGAGMATLSDAAMTTAVTLPAGLPLKVKANGTELVTDGMDAPLDLTKPVEITADVDKPTATYYSMALIEVTVSGTTATGKVIVDAVTTGAPSFKLPAKLFQVGHMYIVTFRAHEGGFTNAADGDFQTFSLPYSTSALDSALFTVVAP